MSESIGQGGTAALHPRGIGDILVTAIRLYRQYWETLLAIAGVVWSPSPCCSTRVVTGCAPTAGRR